MMKPEPRAEHQWLQKLVGEWTSEGEANMGPGKPPEKFKSSERVRSLGGLWVLGESTGDMPGGGTADMVITLGYDPQRGRFVGTWIGSMMTWLWTYDGWLDAAKNRLTLDAEGPSMADDGKLAKYRDTIEFKGDDHRILTSQVLTADGQWNQFMTAHYRRK